MSKHFEEAKLVITANVVYDPDNVDLGWDEEMMSTMLEVMDQFVWLHKDLKIKLEGFICDDK